MGSQTGEILAVDLISGVKNGTDGEKLDYVTRIKNEEATKKGLSSEIVHVINAIPDKNQPQNMQYIFSASKKKVKKSEKPQ
jgi:hypothetical protein